MRTLRSYDTVDGFGRPERRLGLVVEMQQQEICESRFDMKPGRYWPVKDSERPDPFSSFGRRAQSRGHKSGQLLESLLPAMILGEATSSIDTRTEAIVQRGMDRLMEGRTTFVITHRLSTVRNSDVIIVLGHGRVIERGIHNGLIA